MKSQLNSDIFSLPISIQGIIELQHIISVKELVNIYGITGLGNKRSLLPKFAMALLKKVMLKSLWPHSATLNNLL